MYVFFFFFFESAKRFGLSPPASKDSKTMFECSKTPNVRILKPSEPSEPFLSADVL